MEAKEKIKAPEYKNGMLICPYCHFPLVGVEENHLKIKCFICNKVVGKIPIKIMKRIFDDTPVQVLNEWLTEMKSA